MLYIYTHAYLLNDCDLRARAEFHYTKVALERSRMVLCSLDWGAHGGNEYWQTLLDRLTISSVQLPDEAIYFPLGRKTPIRKPGWGSMRSVVDGGLTSIP